LFISILYTTIILSLKSALKKEEIQMAYVINDTCVSCGACAGECPTGAISQGDTQFNIDAGACIDCGTCEGLCPTGAIHQG